MRLHYFPITGADSRGRTYIPRVWIAPVARDPSSWTMSAKWREGMGFHHRPPPILADTGGALPELPSHKRYQTGCASVERRVQCVEPIIPYWF